MKKIEQEITDKQDILDKPEANDAIDLYEYEAPLFFKIIVSILGIIVLLVIFTFLIGFLNMIRCGDDLLCLFGYN